MPTVKPKPRKSVPKEGRKKARTTQRSIDAARRAEEDKLRQKAAEKSFQKLEAMFAYLEKRTDVYDFEPWILFFYGKGPDPDVRVRPRPYVNPWAECE